MYASIYIELPGVLFCCLLFVCLLRQGITVFPRLASNSWAQEIFLPQPPQLLE
jgi:hypothetical protein